MPRPENKSPTEAPSQSNTSAAPEMTQNLELDQPEDKRLEDAADQTQVKSSQGMMKCPAIHSM